MRRRCDRIIEARGIGFEAAREIFPAGTDLTNGNDPTMRKFNIAGFPQDAKGLDII